MFTCKICLKELCHKRSLQRHLKNNACKINCEELYKRIEKLELNQVVTQVFNITNVLKEQLNSFINI